MLFLGIEILSIPLYVLAGSRREDLSGNEAALKYFIMGAFTTGVFLFGTALMYGATGSFSLGMIEEKIAHAPSSMMVNVGIGLMATGLCFKISAVPFHFWAPDVYEGSPNLITVFMATVVKTAAIAAFFRLFSTAFAPVFSTWGDVLAVVSALTMTLANVTAIFQFNFKRMMAYSSISHAGYLLLGMLAVESAGSGGALLIYTISYSIATICAFGVFVLVSEQQNDDRSFEAFTGLGKTQPFLAAIMAVCMLSLAGIPPLAGFFGKYFLFAGAFEKYPLLVLLAIVNSSISIYYYFRVLNAMYFSKEKALGEKVVVPVAYRWVMLAGLLLMAVLAVTPGGVYGLLR
jgi:NADH-quinone oxidoreductase subunit N